MIFITTDKLIKKIFQQTLINIFPYCSFLLSFSGGIDSIVLLDILFKLKNFSDSSILDLRSIYIDHGFNKNSDKYISHCEYECNQRNIKFKFIKVFINKSIIKKEGMESTLRTYRYQLLEDELTNNEVLLTAHNKDDQVETILLALKRGSGPTGLSGMSINSKFSNYRLIRPLLNFSRIQIMYYANKFNLNWINDNSNVDIKFDRNFIRFKILPLLENRWPKFKNNIIRSANLCSKQENLLNEMLCNTFKRVINFKDKSLRISLITKMSINKIFIILRKWISLNNIKMLSNKQLHCLWFEVALSKNDSLAKFKFKNFSIQKFRNTLHVIFLNKNFPKNFNLFWDNSLRYINLPLGYGIIVKHFHVNLNNELNLKKIINYENLQNSFHNFKLLFYYLSSITIVREPEVNEKIFIRFNCNIINLLKIIGINHKRKIKKIWQKLNVPPWLRSVTPMLFYNNTLISALGIFITKEAECKINKNNRLYFFYWKNNF